MGEGMVRRHNHLKLGLYHQHLHELLEMDLSPLDYMMKKFPEFKERDEMRKVIGRYGITGKSQTAPIKQLSDGQKCRVVFAWLSWQIPHMLLLDEPTNHLDLETIDALADAINGFNGGMVLVSHDFRLINQVANEIWECRDGDIHKWQGDILSYKDHLIEHMNDENVNMAQSADNKKITKKVVKKVEPIKKPTTSIKIGYAPPRKEPEEPKSVNGNGKSNGNATGGYVPPHLRKKIPTSPAGESDDWFG